jgi:hypothetical protein
MSCHSASLKLLGYMRRILKKVEMDTLIKYEMNF